MMETLEPLAVREPVARKLLGGISRETLWKLRRAGKVRTYTVGASRFYPVEGLRRFIQEQCGADDVRPEGRS
jgi:hypothetical protein